MFKEISQALGTPSRAKLLKFFLLQPSVRATAFDAAAIVGINKQVAARDARALVRIGLLTSRSTKKKMLFSLKASHPLVPALRAFLESTLPDGRAILSAFKGISGISLIIASGILAKEERSPVDLLMVAKKVQNPRIAKAVAKIEHMMAAPIRYIVLEPKTFSERLEAHDRLIRDVLEFQKKVISGRAP